MASSTVGMFLFLTLLLTSIASSYNLLTHRTLTVGSLPSLPSLSPPSDQSLYSSSDLRRSNSVHLALYHVDSLFPLLSNSTPSHYLHLRLRRDASRVESILRASTSSFKSTVISGLPQGSGEYFTRIGVGTPPTSIDMVLDTGSDIVWLQCSPCHKCYNQSDPVFNPNTSLSFAFVPCFSHQCRFLDIAGCDIRRRSCLYQVSYGDGSNTAGELATETFTFHGGMKLNGVAFGCGHDNEGLFVGAGGLLGLGRGRLSFPAQVKRRFSYCLADRMSGSKNHSSTSTLVFGKENYSKMIRTPMIMNPRLNTFYYMEVMDISVGGTKLPGAIRSDLKLDQLTGQGGVIIDSGTSVTRLARPTYVALRDAFRRGARGLKVADEFSLFDTCYDLTGKKVVKVPTVVFHLGGGGQLSLPSENYLIPVDRKGVFCLAFAGTDDGISIIGNIQQQGFRVVFDEVGSTIGFGRNGC